jgi:S-adenosylmethionine-dependent methyltransferase
VRSRIRGCLDPGDPLARVPWWAAWIGVTADDEDRADARPPQGAELDALLDCEEQAGRTDPYRRVAALTHVLAVRD